MKDNTTPDPKNQPKPENQDRGKSNKTTSPQETSKAKAKEKKQGKNKAKQEAGTKAEYKILPSNRDKMTCPLCIIGEHSYVATWMDAEEIRTKKIQKRLFIVRDDGEFFGLDKPLSELGFEVQLNMPLEPSDALSPNGVADYRNKKFPYAATVFHKLVDLIDQFMDFNMSLADQNTMCEFMACFILSTWFLDATNVAGYLWITGERGSGKSILLTLISKLSFLGFFSSISASSASIRDMSDYRATLCFDDAENITNPQKTDPDKYAIILAGNRKGVAISIKVPGPDKQWQIKRVNVFSPKAFSAIGTPPPTLSSRCIFVPMLRSNSNKANFEAEDVEQWKYDRSQLIDDLTLLALKHLRELKKFDGEIGKITDIKGRNLQPWRGTLGIAKWMDSNGEKGLYDRILNMALNYQKQKFELESPDPTSIVIQALCKCVNDTDNSKNNGKTIVSVADVTAAANNIIRSDEIDIQPLDGKKVGKILSHFRFNSSPRSGGVGSRKYVIDHHQLINLASSFSVPFSLEAVEATSQNDGSTGTNGTLAQMSENSTGVAPNKCHFCGHNKFWQRFDGEWICGVCHPNPSSQKS